MGMKKITLTSGIKFIVTNDRFIPTLISHLSQLKVLVNIQDTNLIDLERTNYARQPNLISDFDRLVDEDIL